MFFYYACISFYTSPSSFLLQSVFFFTYRLVHSLIYVYFFHVPALYFLPSPPSFFTSFSPFILQFTLRSLLSPLLSLSIRNNSLSGFTLIFPCSCFSLVYFSLRLFRPDHATTQSSFPHISVSTKTFLHNYFCHL